MQKFSLEHLFSSRFLDFLLIPICLGLVKKEGEKDRNEGGGSMLASLLLSVGLNEFLMRALYKFRCFLKF